MSYGEVDSTFTSADAAIATTPKIFCGATLRAGAASAAVVDIWDYISGEPSGVCLGSVAASAGESASLDIPGAGRRTGKGLAATFKSGSTGAGVTVFFK